MELLMSPLLMKDMTLSSNCYRKKYLVTVTALRVTETARQVETDRQTYR